MFGEIGSPARRRHLGGDFFSDIFPGSESSCSSPTRIDRDGYPLSPGSQVLSPARSPVPRGEPYFGGSSLPAQLSLSMKLAEGIDQPPFNSPSHSGPSKKDVASDAFIFPSSQITSMHSSSTRAIPLNDGLRHDANSSYRQSPLSRQTSHVLDKSSETTGSASLSFETQSQKDTTRLEGYVSNNQFHFSIYKWAGKGVTLIIPSATKENKSRFRRLPELVLHGADMPSYDDNMPTPTIASKTQSGNHDNKLPDLIIDANDDAISARVEELLPVGSESKPLDIDELEESDTFERTRRTPVTIDRGWNPEARNLQQLFDENMDTQGKEDIIKPVEKTQKTSRGQKSDYGDADAKQKSGRENIKSNVEVFSSSMEDVQVPLEQKVQGSRVKGKVRDFIKIFNHDSLPKRKGVFETQDRRSKGKDGVKGKVENQVNTSTPKIVDEEKVSSTNSAPSKVEEKASSRTESLLDTPIITERYGSTTASDVHMVDDPSLERRGTSGTFSGSTPEVIDVSVCNVEESHCEDLEDCLVEQLTEAQNEQLQNDLHQEQIKISDVKIREWSKGKEGNIRSLLSTLQYVLWPESGWKPVPLVSIIEGPSVKRAYQRALLYLHPDKLQQKGAAMHQKYIAEKVFDILQEAWDNFNTLSSF